MEIFQKVFHTLNSLLKKPITSIINLFLRCEKSTFILYARAKRVVYTFGHFMDVKLPSFSWHPKSITPSFKTDQWRQKPTFTPFATKKGCLQMGDNMYTGHFTNVKFLSFYSHHKSIISLYSSSHITNLCLNLITFTFLI